MPQFLSFCQSLSKVQTDKTEVWDEFFTYFKEKHVDDIPGIFAYYLAHVPWHLDIWGGSDRITSETREYAQRLISAFGKSDIIKLLKLIGEKGISRGTPGQSVEVLISTIPKSNEHLLEIANDIEMPLQVREYAGIIFAYHNQKTAIGLQKSVELLRDLSNESEVASFYHSNLKKYHSLVLY